MIDPGVVLQIRNVTKDYRSLRPLRIERLEMSDRESCALLGFDQVMTEVFVDLVTGRTVPDTGEIVVCGRPTTAIEDGDAWLKTLNRFGLVSERGVLLAQFTVEQTLAMPFSLDIDELSEEARRRVTALADEVGLGPDLARQVATLSPLGRQRLRLACAISLEPRLLVMEHPNGPLAASEASAFASDVRRIAGSRAMATVVLTADETFGEAAAGRVLTLQPATGELKSPPAWRKWFA